MPVLDSLDERDLQPEPVAQFSRWFDEAVAARVPEPEAMCVASVADDGSPSARMVLLHVLAETAQHAGHADIIREAIDGAKTMG